MLQFFVGYLIGAVCAVCALLAWACVKVGSDSERFD